MSMIRRQKPKNYFRELTGAVPKMVEARSVLQHVQVLSQCSEEAKKPKETAGAGLKQVMTRKLLVAQEQLEYYRNWCEI